jgi:hypothetical protein
MKHPDYPCRYPECYRVSEYYAKDNRAQFGHLCRVHVQYIATNRKDEYEKVSVFERQ